MSQVSSVNFRKSLFWVSLISVLIWMIPAVRALLLPLVLLNTHLHEFGHALAGIATGGSILRIEVYSNGSGLTPISGGNLFIVAMAGYVGASLIGGLIIVSTRSAKSARIAIGSLGVAIILSSVAWVRADWVGVTSGWSIGAALVLFSLKSNENLLIWVTQFIGIQQCMTSLYSLFVLMKITTGTDLQNDAMLVENATGVSSWIWASAWCAISISAMWLAFRKVLKADVAKQ